VHLGFAILLTSKCLQINQIRERLQHHELISLLLFNAAAGELAAVSGANETPRRRRRLSASLFVVKQQSVAC
jgi:hypothetical protein